MIATLAANVSTIGDCVFMGGAKLFLLRCR